MRLLRPVHTRRYNIYRLVSLLIGSITFGLTFATTQIQLFIDNSILAMVIIIGYAATLAILAQIVFGYLEYRAMKGNNGGIAV